MTTMYRVGFKNVHTGVVAWATGAWSDDQYTFTKEEALQEQALQNRLFYNIGADNVTAVIEPMPEDQQLVCPGEGCTDQGCPAHYAK